MPTTVHLKKSVITAQHAAAALAVVLGVSVYIVYRQLGLTVAFAVIGAFYVGLARWTQRNPVLRADDEGITLKRAVLSSPVQLPWSKLESVSLAEEKWLDIKVRGEPAIRLLATNLEEAPLQQLLAVSRAKA